MRTTFSIGAIPLDGAQVIPFPPDHPTRAGATRLDIEATQGVVSAADFQPGFLHRGAEKLFEARDYRCALMLGDRHDWQSAFSGELSIALTCEAAMGLVAPERATWLRTVLAELARIHSHLAILAYLPWRFGEEGLWHQLAGIRNEIRELFGDSAGNRLHPMFNRLGGLAKDVSPAWLERVGEFGASLGQFDVLADLAKHPSLRIGTLSATDASQYGLSGPVSAASGYRMEARDGCYLAYGELPQIPTAPSTTGTAGARFLALTQEVATSAALIAAGVAALPEGPVNVKLSKIVRVPESETYHAIAAPWGIAGCLLVSRGGTTPWRLGLRTPTFANCSALATALIGTPIEQVGDVIASLGYSIGDLDR